MTTPVSEKKPSTAKSVLGAAARTVPALSKGPGWAAFVGARKAVQALRARWTAGATPSPAPAVAAVAVHDVAEVVKDRRIPRPLIVLGVLAAGVGGGVLFRRLRAREVPPIADAPPTLATTAPSPEKAASNGHAATPAPTTPAPTKAAPVTPAPAKATPAKATPAKATPAKATQKKPAAKPPTTKPPTTEPPASGTDK